MSVDLSRIKRIIANLRMKTEENGCSESEALAAAEKLGKLLQEHDLTLDEATLGEEAKGAEKNVVRAPDEFASSIVVGIGKLCDLIVWRSGPGQYSFFGTPADLEVAVYLYEILSFAIEDDCVKFMEKEGYSMKKRASFRMGFASRVTERLKQLKAERDAAKARMSQTGTNLVVVKEALVKQEFDKLGIRLTKGGTQTAADMNAFGAGRAAGERVNLNSPLTGGNSNTQRLS